MKKIWPDRKTKTCPSCGGPMYKDAKNCKNCKSQKGENNGNWKNGISSDSYHYKLIQKERHPEKIKARNIVSDAIRSGKQTRKPCEICGENEAQAHHEDYSKPLAVNWLCKKHHREIHFGMKFNQESNPGRQH